MKKSLNKKLGSFIVVAALIIACINISIDRNNNESVISFDNVEALANGEDPRYSCLYFGTLDCPPSPIKVKIIME